ncbi:hypothetical protein [Natrarchaeobius chitinivorans]|uniref:Uncharacterized protein n=1 Tax=Natrarchaeobius chitinivorans TaxID=1679083 RepID=A0A3N6LX80_NATCH|nr:hypothetical protein [Natrarchaeobius chitinivorans]RQG92364.1 hypothetical protein EA473_16400 [Natrarchaeobius chitinivorans]
MSHGRDVADGTGVDGSSETDCDRCGKRVRDDRVIRLSSDPCFELSGRYEAVTETCCSDCIAGIGLLAFTAEARAYSPSGSE